VRPLVSASLAAALALSTAATPAPAETPRWVGMPEIREASPRDRERATQHALHSARSLRKRGELEQAEAVLTHGLRANPRSAALLREHARVLETLGQGAAARAAWRRADAIDPPAGPLPDAALPSTPGELLIVLLSPDPTTRAERRPLAWPEGAVAGELEQRLRARLPAVRIVHADFDDVAAAKSFLPGKPMRAVISLRVDRVYCGDTIKDGRFGLAWLRIAGEQPGATASGAQWARSVIDEPQLPRGCPRESIARALEHALALPWVRALVATAPLARGEWSTGAIRSLFPDIERRIEAGLAEGRGQLATGRLAAAQRTFEAVAAVDPEDPIPASYLRDVTATLTLSRELARRRGGNGDDLDPRMSAAARAALEAQLVAERARRDALLTALAVLGEGARLPTAAALAGLTPVAQADPDGFGVQLARSRAGGAVHARAALAPDGSELARYYFPEHHALPVLREEDSDGDGVADRWIGYAGDQRAEIWEGAAASGRPDVRLILAGDGVSLRRVEVDRDGNGSPERVMYYTGGALRVQATDSNANGRLDTFERFSADGSILVREEDVNGDGEIDVRSEFRAGKLVRRAFAHDGLPARQ
jgi:tetratricopeptide (TPR) repeat protein